MVVSQAEATVDQRALIERASEGDHDAFGMLIGARLARLDTAARLIVRDAELARDAVQEATLHAWRKSARVARPGQVRRVAAPTDRQRMPRSRPSATRPHYRDQTHTAPRHAGPGRFVPDDDTIYVERMLADLGADQQAVVVLHYFLDLSLPETAAALGIPVGTDKSRLNRALAAMRYKIANEELVILPTRAERMA